MTAYSREIINKHIAVGLDRQCATKERGDALENLFCYLLEALPGVYVRRNARDPFDCVEIDIAVANERKARWMQLFPPVFLVECKNWDAKVDSGEVSKFASKLRYRRINTGILVAANGITGDPSELRSAHQIVAFEQQGGHRILVVTLEQLQRVEHTEHFAALLRDAVLELACSGKFLSA